jgi:hypothetical protein
MNHHSHLFLVKDDDQAAKMLAKLEGEPRTAPYRIDSEAYAVQYNDPIEVVIVGRMDYFNLESWM